jgi:hypothetical protein
VVRDAVLSRDRDRSPATRGDGGHDMTQEEKIIGAKGYPPWTDRPPIHFMRNALTWQKRPARRFRLHRHAFAQNNAAPRSLAGRRCSNRVTAQR